MRKLQEIKVVMADDHQIFRDGFKLILNNIDHITLVAAASDGQELLELVEKHQPNVVITDIKMPIMDGIEATRKIQSNWPDIGIIGLSMFDEEDLIIEMLEAGALGYLVKNADKNEVIEAIEAVSCNEFYYCKETSNRLAVMISKNKSRHYVRKKVVEFTEKEIEIIQLICKEYTTKEIGDKLFLSTRTIDGHRLKILEKMEVKNTVGMVVYALQHQIYKP
ncbi:MAG: response regulator transcription factor [Bacteroidota bacterium]